MGHVKSNERVMNTEETWQAESLLWNNFYSFVKSMALKCAIRLRIPEIIHNHGRPAALHELMAAVPIPDAKADPLRRLMRLLTDSGIFAVDQNGAYALTPASRLLLPGPGGTSLALNLLLSLDPDVVGLWNHLDEWYKVEDGAETPFQVAHGMNTWDYFRCKPRLQGWLNDAMAADSGHLMGALLNNCGDVFRGLRSVVDAGGGVGMAAKTIARAFPEIEVTVLDQPHVVAGLPEEEDDSGVKFVGGDFFKSVPPADAVFLKSVLHDWTDEECVEILKKCKEAIPSKEAGGKVIIVDMVVDPSCSNGVARETQFAYDVLMLVVAMGKEREKEEWKKIFEEAGFSDYKFTPALGYRCVIEVYP